MIAVLLTWAATCGLILVGGFGYLLNLSALFFVVLYVAVMVGVLRLRKTEPDADRPYRAWGHPLSTVFCILGWTLITGFMAYTAPRSAISAVVMTVLALPVYLVVIRIRKKKVV
jgi:APA family basic amino acid/polyamine antiporter